MLNDVLQSVMLKKTRYDCSIGFSILPLSYGIEDLFIEGHCISQLRRGVMKGWNWRFETSSLYRQCKNGDYETIYFNDGCADDIVSDMLSIVSTNVMPIFEKGVDCASAIEELRKYESSVYDDKHYAMLDNGRYLWYIKIGDYVKAACRLEAIIEQQHCDGYDRLVQTILREKRIRYLRLDHEIGMSDDFQKTKYEVLSREGIDPEYKEQLLSRDMFFAYYKQSRSAAVFTREISKLNQELGQLSDDHSSLSIEIEKQRVETEMRRQPKIEHYKNLLERLRVPDTVYLEALISNNEKKSMEFLNNPSKYHSS